MSKKERPQETAYGPSWADCRNQLREVGAAHNMRCDVHMCAAQGVDTAERWSVTVRAFKWGHWGEDRPYAIMTSTWPHVDHKTLTSLVFKLIDRLDWRMTEMQEKAARAAARTALEGKF